MDFINNTGHVLVLLGASVRCFLFYLLFFYPYKMSGQSNFSILINWTSSLSILRVLGDIFLLFSSFNDLLLLVLCFKFPQYLKPYINFFFYFPMKQ